MLGFPNAYGAPFIVFWALATATLLADLELVGASRAFNAGFSPYSAGPLAHLQKVFGRV